MLKTLNKSLMIKNTLDEYHDVENDTSKGQKCWKTF